MASSNNLLEDGMADARRARATGFLDEEMYTKMIQDMMRDPDQSRLIININDVRNTEPELAQEILNHPFEMMNAFNEGLNEITKRAEGFKATDTKYNVGFHGSFGDNNLTPRSVSASMLGKMLSIEGIVARSSLVRPKVVRSVHYCPETSKHVSRVYRDQTSLEAGGPTGSTYPTVDDDGNALVTEYGLSTYRDHQMLFIQEMPERAPAGQLPRSIQAIVEDDLVDMVKPGDRIRIVGAYKTLGGKQQGVTSGIFKSVLVTNNIILLNKEVQAPNLTATDIKNIRKTSKDKGKGIFDLLSASLAPSIHGMDYIKRAMLCVLLGGVEKNLANGTHLRGDINVMMVGDPSTAKSQVLRFVLRTAPLAVATTGRGSSGVGLTAAVTVDPDTNERRLEAGAMVLADRGVVCIDEFDKMSEADRVAIHEVMEQQTVTVAKGGIHASLNARCSVVAAANPVFGQYDSSKRPNENIQLPDSLLSRFDLLFIVLDTADPVKDKILCEHVLRMHQYRDPNQQDGEVIVMNDTTEVEEELNEEADDDDGTSEVWAKTKIVSKAKGKKNQNLLSTAFVKKYIHYAKHRVTPILTQAACEMLSETYTDLRQNGEELKTLPITARCFETLIRLSTAHAKARLSNTIEVVDCKQAMVLLNYALYQNAGIEKHGEYADESDGDDDDKPETKPKKTEKKTKPQIESKMTVPKKSGIRRKARTAEEDGDGDDGDDGDGDDGDDGDDSAQTPAVKRRRLATADLEAEVVVDEAPTSTRMARMKKRTTEQPEAMEEDSEEEEPEITMETVTDSAKISDFRLRMNSLFVERGTTALLMEDIFEAFQASFNKGQVMSMLQAMSDENSIMLTKKVVYRV